MPDADVPGTGSFPDGRQTDGLDGGGDPDVAADHAAGADERSGSHEGCTERRKPVQGRLADPARYGGKLLSGLKRLFFLLIWSVPLLFCAYQAKTHIAGETDVITLLEIIRDNFGGGNTVQGVFYIVLIAVATLLVLAAGCAFHSGARHARAQGDPKLVNGHHGKIMLTWLCALVTLLPLIAALGILVLRYAPALGNPEELISGSAHLPSTRISAVILAAGAVLTVPLLPLRSLISAAFVDGLKGKDA